MRKVVISCCFGGFGISLECAKLMAKLGNSEAKNMVHEYNEALKKPTIIYHISPHELQKKIVVEFYGHLWETKRDNPELVAAVEKLGDAANSRYSKLKVVEIPDNVKWHIEEYDGNERIAEDHMTWR